MIPKRAASFLILLSLVTVGLPFAAAQSVPRVPEGKAELPGAFPLSIFGQAAGGLLPRGPLTPWGSGKDSLPKGLDQQRPAATYKPLGACKLNFPFCSNLLLGLTACLFHDVG
jgi:hypothetical protein